MPDDQPHPLAVLIRNIILGLSSLVRVLLNKKKGRCTARRSVKDTEMSQGSTEHIDHTNQLYYAQRRVNIAIENFVDTANEIFTDGSLEKCVRNSAARWKEGS